MTTAKQCHLHTRLFLHCTVKCRPSVMALNDSCHLLIDTKHHFIQKSGGGLEPLSPIASAATDTNTNRLAFNIQGVYVQQLLLRCQHIPQTSMAIRRHPAGFLVSTERNMMLLNSISHM